MAKKMEEKSLVTYPAPENMFLLSNEELDICAEVSVKLLAVHSPADFHVIPACLLAKLETITDILMEQDFAGNMENRFPQGELKVETPAACYIDQRWARVEVGTVGALGDCHVKLVDYGLYKFVRTEQLRRLPAQLVIWPPLAYHCRQDSLPTRDLTHARVEAFRRQYREGEIVALQSPGELIPRYDTRGRQAVRIKGFSPGYDDKFIRGDKTHRYFAGDSDDEDLIGCSGRIFF